MVLFNASGSSLSCIVNGDIGAYTKMELIVSGVIDMEFIQPNPTQAQAGLRALITVAKASDGTLHEIEKRTLLAAQQYLIDAHFPIDEQSIISEEELVDAIDDPKLRQQLCHAFVVLVMASGEVDKARLKQAEKFAKAMKVNTAYLRVLEKQMNNHLLLMRLDFMRRSYVKNRLQAAWKQGGLMNVIRTIRGVAGFGKVEPKITEKYLPLKDYPEGSLGRTYYEHLRENNFSLPGEKNGAPEGLVVHDLNHVLGDYDTDPEGEVQVLFFQAGHSNAEPLSFIILILLQFNLGVAMVGFAETKQHVFDPEKAFAAFKRGLLVSQPLFEAWDYEPDLKEQVSDLRKKYNIVDKNQITPKD